MSVLSTVTEVIPVEFPCSSVLPQGIKLYVSTPFTLILPVVTPSPKPPWWYPSAVNSALNAFWELVQAYSTNIV